MAAVEQRPTLMRALGRPGIALAAAAAVALLASFLPWASFLGPQGS